METLSELSERGLIRRLRPQLVTRPDVLLGAGDDCALVKPPPPGEELVLKSDPIIAGRHFLPDTDPKRIGHKALGRVLSDFAAMGATPQWALIDFTAPPDTPISVADGIYAGIKALAERHHVAIVGGDTTSDTTLSLHVFAAGSVPAGKAMRRAAANPGDSLYVTGTLGRSFESGRHLSFEPRLDVGRWLLNRGIRCAIDISDGLASELWHIAEESNARLFLIDSAVPLSPTCARMPDPLTHALDDGEDFELLFSVPPDDFHFLTDFLQAFPNILCTPIGMVGEHLEGGRVTYGNSESGGKILPKKGFDHFSE